MTKAWIVQGDPTSSGGSVITGSSFTDIDGIPVARIGDQATCPRHKGAFPIVDGDSTMIVDGQPVALHGSSLACGCKVLSARQVRVFIEAGTSAAAATSTAPAASALASATAATAAAAVATEAATAAATARSHEGGFVLRSSLTGKPLANRNYRILHADGACETGTTNADGATHVVASDCCQTLRIELEEEGP